MVASIGFAAIADFLLCVLAGVVGFEPTMTDSKSVALGHLGDTPNYRITLFSAIHYTIRLKQAQSDAVGFEPTPFFFEKIRLFAVVILLSLD